MVNTEASKTDSGRRGIRMSATRQRKNLSEFKAYENRGDTSSSGLVTKLRYSIPRVPLLVCHPCGIQLDSRDVLFQICDLFKNPWRLTRTNQGTGGDTVRRSMTAATRKPPIPARDRYCSQGHVDQFEDTIVAVILKSTDSR
jgi:hypothetical protein